MTAGTARLREPDVGKASCQSARAILDELRTLVPKITARAGEIETARRVPIDLVEEMRRIGVFRALVPKQSGGLGLGIRESMQIIEALAIADGSAGWIAMIGGDGALHFEMLPTQTFERIYAKGPDVIGGGSVRIGQGMMVPVDGGYRVTGRWNFASGCQHADWLVAWAPVVKDGVPVPGAWLPGMPQIRQAALPATAFHIIENWDTLGLRGTGSHDIALDDLFVPEEQTNEILAKPFNYDVARVTLRLGSVAVGIAEGALGDLVALDKVRGGNAVPLSETPIVLEALGIAEAGVKAARAYLDREALLLDEQTKENGGDDVALRSASQAVAWVTDACIDAIQRCLRVAGTKAIHASSPLQRRLRDIHTLSQHGVTASRNYLPAGAQRFGLDMHPYFSPRGEPTPSRS